MRRSSIIGHVVELLDTIRSSPYPADVLTREFFRKRHYLGSRDRREISSRVYGILRTGILLEATCRNVFRVLGRGPAVPPAIALLVAYELKETAGPPDSLLLDAGTLWRMSISAVGPEEFVHTLLALPPPYEEVIDPVGRAAMRYSLPEFAVKQWYDTFGAAQAVRLCESLNEEAPTTIRVNTLRCTPAECAAALRKNGIHATPTALSPVGLTLEKRINAQSLQAFREGWFEMQDEGSQIIGSLANPKAGMRVVDACAGAGGKALHLAAQMENRGALLAIDEDPRRLHHLGERVARAGVGIIRTAVAGKDEPVIASWTEDADVVLVDAPCSGSGTLRRNPALRMHITTHLVEQMSRLQLNLLTRYATLVRPGGRLVYSTCSLLSQENEGVLQSFVSTHPWFVLEHAATLLAESGVSPAGAGQTVTLLPHAHGTDGFFMAVLSRNPRS